MKERQSYAWNEALEPTGLSRWAWPWDFWCAHISSPVAQPDHSNTYRFMKLNSAVAARLLRNVLMMFACCAGLADGPAKSPPVIDHIERDATSIRFHLTVPPLFDYFVEATDSLSPPDWLLLTTHRAKVAPIDIIFTNSLSNAQQRYFRVRQQPCFCRETAADANE
jgi:hypothetical protein